MDMAPLNDADLILALQAENRLFTREMESLDEEITHLRNQNQILEQANAHLQTVLRKLLRCQAEIRSQQVQIRMERQTALERPTPPCACEPAPQ